MTTDELRAKFESWVSKRHGLSTARWQHNGMYAYDRTREWWEAWLEAHTSRDAEVEALRRKSFALDALVAAGFVTEAKLAESLNIAGAAMAKGSVE